MRRFAMLLLVGAASQRLFVPEPAAAQAASASPSILTVDGSGRAQAKPDFARITCNK